MREQGWVYGRDYVVERRLHGDEFEHVFELTTEWVQSGADVFLLSGVGMARHVQQVTHTAPIVTGAARDLVAAGLAASLARPGGNVTGVQVFGPEMVGKQVALLREASPISLG
jgi:putative ABC transport system substrate-binding protein